MSASRAQEAVSAPAHFRNILRVGAFHNEPQGGTSGCCFPMVKKYENATGYRLSIEHKLGSLVGLDFAFTDLEQKADAHDFGVDYAEKFPVRSFGLDLLFHPGHAGRHLDYYLGAGIHYVSFGDRFTDIRDVGAPVLRAGLDITFGDAGRWALNLDLQRMYTNVSSTRDTNDYSPLRYGAALALRF